MDKISSEQIYCIFKYLKNKDIIIAHYTGVSEKNKNIYLAIYNILTYLKVLFIINLNYIPSFRKCELFL